MNIIWKCKLCGMGSNIRFFEHDCLAKIKMEIERMATELVFEKGKAYKTRAGEKRIYEGSASVFVGSFLHIFRDEVGDMSVRDKNGNFDTTGARVHACDIVARWLSVEKIHEREVEDNAEKIAKLVNEALEKVLEIVKAVRK